MIQEDQRLSIGAGTLIESSELVGGSLAALEPTIYTSSNSLPGQPDSLLKFTYNNPSLTLRSTTQMDGEILDLAITDLNHDNAPELLITIRRNAGIYVDVKKSMMKKLISVLLLLFLTTPAYSIRKPHYGGALRVADSFAAKSQRTNIIHCE